LLAGEIGVQSSPSCAASGALALALRTVALGGGWSMEAASFVAAESVGGADGKLLLLF